MDTFANAIAHDSAAVRLSCAVSLADAAEHFPAQVGPTVDGLQKLYVEKSKSLEPEVDRFVSLTILYK